MVDDALQRMLDAQARLQARMPAFKEHGMMVEDALTGRWVSSRTLQLKENAVMLMVEATEVLDGLSWKMHKQDFGRPLRPEEMTHVREELIDALHFVINGLLLVDVTTSEGVESEFFRKHKINNDRQDAGY